MKSNELTLLYAFTTAIGSHNTVYPNNRIQEIRELLDQGKYSKDFFKDIDLSAKIAEEAWAIANKKKTVRDKILTYYDECLKISSKSRSRFVRQGLSIVFDFRKSFLEEEVKSAQEYQTYLKLKEKFEP